MVNISGSGCSVLTSGRSSKKKDISEVMSFGGTLLYGSVSSRSHIVRGLNEVLSSILEPLKDGLFLGRDGNGKMRLMEVSIATEASNRILSSISDPQKPNINFPFV
jgi:hypothetical protein